MVCEMVMEDIAELERQGIRLTPAEIVRLNCLGLRVSRSPEAADLFAAPRIGWAGPVAIHEPTLQSETWIATYAARWWSDLELDAARLFACAHAPVPGMFSRDELLSPVSAAETVNRWTNSLPCTGAQLNRAYLYAVEGADPDFDVVAAPSSRAAREDAPAVTDADLSAGLADAAIAEGLGLPVSELATLSQARVIALLRRRRISTGALPPSSDMRAHAAYARTLTAIRKAHESEAARG